jgi:hypothetical protein
MKYTVTTTDQYHEVLFDLDSYKILQQFAKSLTAEQLEEEIKVFQQNLMGNE